MLTNHDHGTVNSEVQPVTQADSYFLVDVNLDKCWYVK